MGAGNTRLGPATMWLTARLILGSGVAGAATLFVASQVTASQWAPFGAAIILMQSVNELLFRGYAGLAITSKEYPTPRAIGTFVTRQLLVALSTSVVTVCLAVLLARNLEDSTFVILLMATIPSQFSIAIRSLSIALLEREFRFRLVATIELAETAVFSAAVVLTVLASDNVAWLAVPLAFRGALGIMLIRLVAPATLVRPQLRANDVPTRGARHFLEGSAVQLCISAVPLVGFALAKEQAQLGAYQFAVALFTYALVFVQAIMRVGFAAYSRRGVDAWRSVSRSIVLMSTFSGAVCACLVLLSHVDIDGGNVLGDSLAVVSDLAPGYTILAGSWTVLAPMAMSQGHAHHVRNSLCVSLVVFAAGTVLAPHAMAASNAIAWSFNVACATQLVALAVLLAPLLQPLPRVWLSVGACLSCSAATQLAVVSPAVAVLIILVDLALFVVAVVLASRKPRQVTLSVGQGG